jgi:hypothetical protein
MRYIELQVVDEGKCQDELPHDTYTVDTTMMCAYAEGKDACHGDNLFKICTNFELHKTGENCRKIQPDREF